MAVGLQSALEDRSRRHRQAHAGPGALRPDHVVATASTGESAFPVAGVVETCYRSSGDADLATSAPNDFAALLEDELALRPRELPGLLDERHLLRDMAVPMLTREHLSAPSEAPDGVIALVFNSEHQGREAMSSIAGRAAEALGVEDLQLLLTHEYRMVQSELIDVRSTSVSPPECLCTARTGAAHTCSSTI
ncbi:hypothetical protein [Streptomyces sp. NPDC000618]|uniref:hypothetical protein n=1 Tax=Streptomyces sp. NPDC000618 TaxID=3154265 RepID=UPI00331A7C99